MGYYEKLDETTARKVAHATNPNCIEEFARFGSGKCFLPIGFSDYANSIENFKVREDDIWLVSFMKTGTTWVKELIWLLVNDLDFNTARNKVCYDRFPNLESSGTIKFLKTQSSSAIHRPSSIEILDNVKTSKRLIHTHLPWQLLPNSIQTGFSKPKIIYITRNPKDVVVSYFHHRVLFEGFLGSMDDFVDLFVNDAVRYAPFWNHVQEFWERRDEPNILFLTYEQMKMDLPSTIDTMSNFLETNYTCSKETKLLEYLSFENMKINPAVNHDTLTERFTSKHGITKRSDFIRKGKVDVWKEELSEYSKEQMERWYNTNCIKGLNWTSNIKYLL